MLVLKAIEKFVSLIPYKLRLAMYNTPLVHLGRVILNKLVPSTALVKMNCRTTQGSPSVD